jgi:hypothetical protein
MILEQNLLTGLQQSNVVQHLGLLILKSNLVYVDSKHIQGVRHSGPVIQARDVQAHLFFYVPFRPNFDVIQAQVFFL